METARWLVSLTGLASGVLIVTLLLRERDYPAPHLTRPLIWTVSVSGFGVLAHIALYLLDRDALWLFRYSFGFGIWALVAVPLAAGIYTWRTRALRHRPPA